jgi:chorismate--pyruvate lyase
MQVDIRVLREKEFVNCDADAPVNWRNIKQQFPRPNALYTHWLMAPGSLTKKLQSISDGTFFVRVLSEGWAYQSVSPASGLTQCGSGKLLMWSRRVLLGGHGENWVAAHSLIPITTLRGANRQLIHLGNKPLGGFLFKQRGLMRGDTQICQCDDYWGRRSLFFLDKRSLLVAEFFLPDLIGRIQPTSTNGNGHVQQN